MVALLSWLNDQWFILIQTLGIIGSLWLTGLSLRRETRARKLGDYLTLSGQHRELWSEAHRRPDLGRIFRTEVDLVGEPITVAEEEFLRLVIVHFNTGWLLARDGVVLKLEVLSIDARSFFALPLPAAVWRLVKDATDPEFGRFMENAMSRPPRSPHRIRWRPRSTD